MNRNLVVIRPFGGMKRGDQITDPTKVDAVLGGENALDVVQVPAAPQLAPAQAAAGGR